MELGSQMPEMSFHVEMTVLLLSWHNMIMVMIMMYSNDDIWWFYDDYDDVL